jgi:hypothetical protein
MISNVFAGANLSQTCEIAAKFVPVIVFSLSVVDGAHWDCPAARG